MQITEDLVSFIAKEVNGTTVTEFDGVEIDLGKWRRLTMREAIVEFWPEEAGAKPATTAFESAGVLQARLHAAIDSLEKAMGEADRLSAERAAELKTILGAVTAVYYDSVKGAPIASRFTTCLRRWRSHFSFSQRLSTTIRLWFRRSQSRSRTIGARGAV